MPECHMSHTYTLTPPLGTDLGILLPSLPSPEVHFILFHKQVDPICVLQILPISVAYPCPPSKDAEFSIPTTTTCLGTECHMPAAFLQSLFLGKVLCFQPHHPCGLPEDCMSCAHLMAPHFQIVNPRLTLPNSPNTTGCLSVTCSLTNFPSSQEGISDSTTTLPTLQPEDKP